MYTCLHYVDNDKILSNANISINTYILPPIGDNRYRVRYTELLRNPLESYQGCHVNNIENQNTCRRLTIIYKKRELYISIFPFIPEIIGNI